MSDAALPRGWASTALSDVADIRLGRQRSPKQANGPHMHPYVRAANVTWDGISVQDVKSMNFSPKEFETYALRDGDLLIVEGSGSATEVGKPAVWREEVPDCCFQNTLIRVRASEQAIVPYLLAHFLHDARSGAFARESRGVGIHHIGAKAMSTWTVQLAPLAEQRRIVDKIDALQARSAAARAALQAIPPLLDRFRQSVLAAAFRGDLTRDWRTQNPDVEPASALLERIRAERRRRWIEDYAEAARARAEQRAAKKGQPWTAEDDAKALEKGRKQGEKKYAAAPLPDTSSRPTRVPANWAVVSVGEITECLDRHRRPITRKDRQPGPYPYYGANGQVDSVEGYIFDEELVLVTEDETFYGRTKPIAYRVNGPCWVNNHAHVLRALPEVDVDYVCFVLMHYDVTPWLSGTTGRAKLTQAAMNMLPLGLPPAAEMKAIANAVRELLAHAGEMVAPWDSLTNRLDRLDQSILAKAFRGELVPQDPNDEPASVLLERIRAERADAAPGKKGRGRQPRKPKPPPEPQPDLPGLGDG